ncbi:MAG: efflux RND transporter periplasmic adaptor subunit, partial [Bacteroidota bacterium]
SEPANTPEAKQALLKEKRAQLLALNQEITQLEEELAKLDPSKAKAEKIVPVTTQILIPDDFEHYVEVQGKVESNKTIMVSPQTGGRLTQVNVQEGQRVNQGQIMARIDDAVIKRNIQEVQTQLDLATILFNKQKNLWEQEIGTEVQYLSAKSQKESLERRLETLKEQQDLAIVRAPQTGTVDDVMNRVGETVAPGQPIFLLINNSDLSLSAELSEAYAPYVRRGDQVELSFPILDRTMKAKVKRVGEVINPVNRTFTVEVDLPRSRDYKPNMFGMISINDRTLTDVITIPQSIIQKSDDGEFVYVAMEEGNWVARRRIIQTGLSYDGVIEVKSGLSSQDRLILAGYKSLSDGQRVQINDDNLAGK